MDTFIDMKTECEAMERRARRAGLSIQRMMRAAGVDESCWYRWRGGQQVPRLSSWRAIERVVAEARAAQRAA